MLMPKSLGGEGAWQAYGLTGRRVLGTMTKADDAIWRLLRVGIDSSVQIGEFKELLIVINNP